MTTELFMDSLEKLEIQLDEKNFYIFNFKKDAWTPEDMTAIVSYFARKFPNVRFLAVVGASQSFDVLELGIEDKKNLIIELIKSL